MSKKQMISDWLDNSNYFIRKNVFLFHFYFEIMVSFILFNGISTFNGYLMPKLFLYKKSCGTI